MRLSPQRVIMSAMLLLGSLIIFSATPVQAQNQVSFANFSETGADAVFTFTNNGSGSTLSGSAIPVKFTFTTPNTYGAASQPIAALLTFSSTSALPASKAGALDVENLTGFTATFTAVSPVNGDSNLLTVTTGSSTLSGANGADKVGYSATTSRPGSSTFNPSNVVYSSDFVSFANTDINNFNLSFLNLVDGGQTAPLTIGGNGYIDTFQSEGAGIFDSGPLAVPEASPALGLLIFMAGLALLVMVRNTRQSNRS